MVKVETRIYVDEELWEKFKRCALKKGMEVNNLLEDIMKDEMMDEALDSALLNLAGSENYEIDFEPVKPKEGRVSELIRVMRDKRPNHISGK